MRRWLTILLLFILPVQFAWSAAAAYCQHEEVTGMTHIGHHAHEHKADGGSKSKASGQHADDKSASKSGKLLGDNDCGYCHLSFAKPMVPVELKFDADAVFTM